MAVGSQYHRELARLVTGGRRPEVGPALLAVARQWMRYVVEYCPRGQGLRPRWAKDGFDFVSFCTEPQHTIHLEEEEFKVLPACPHPTPLHDHPPR